MAKRYLTERTRKFLRKIGSIVLGVLIALAIGEVADTLRHRASADRAMAAVRREAGINGLYVEERMIKGRCIARRLEAIRNELAAARSSGKMRRLTVIGRPNIRPLTDVAWTALAGSDDLFYAPPREVLHWRVYSEQLESYMRLQEQEQLGWARLRVLENRAGGIDGDLMAELETTVEELRDYADTLNIMARQQWMTGRMLHVTTDYTTFHTPLQTLVAEAHTSPICQAIR